MILFSCQKMLEAVVVARHHLHVQTRHERIFTSARLNRLIHFCLYLPAILWMRIRMRIEMTEMSVMYEEPCVFLLVGKSNLAVWLKCMHERWISNETMSQLSWCLITYVRSCGMLSAVFMHAINFCFDVVAVFQFSRQHVDSCLFFSSHWPCIQICTQWKNGRFSIKHITGRV